MGFKFNPITASLDIDDANPSDNGTSVPTGLTNGSVVTCEISSDGRIYFWANGTRYYVSGIAAPENVIVSGNPIGPPPFLWMTYP